MSSLKKGILLLAFVMTGCIEVDDNLQSTGSASKISSFASAGNQVSMSPDGTKVVATFNQNLKLAPQAGDGRMRLLDANTGTEILTFDTWRNPNVRSAVFNSDGTKIAAGGSSHSAMGTTFDFVGLWNSTEREAIDYRVQWGGAVHAVAFAPNEKKIVNVGEFKHISLFDFSGDIDSYLKEQHPHEFTSLRPTHIEYIGNGEQILISPKMIFTVQDKSTLELFDKGMTFSVFRDANKILSGWDGAISLFDSKTGKNLGNIYDSKKREVTATTVSRDGKLFATAYSPYRFGDGSNSTTEGYSQINIWRSDDGALIVTIPIDNNQFISSLSLSGNGSKLAAASPNGNITVYQIKP